MIAKSKDDYIVTLEQAKTHLRVDTDSEDVYISDCIKAAVQMAEQYIGKDIATTECTLPFYEFSGSILEIDEGNVASITSITGSVDGALSYDDNPVDYFDSYFSIELNESVSEQTVTVVFNTGYTKHTLPPAIKQAILIKVADFYDVERSSANYVNQNRNKAFESLLNFYVAKRVTYIKN